VADSVRDEPQFREEPFRPDPSEARAEENLELDPRDPDDEIVHAAHDEPHLEAPGGGYASWFQAKRAAVTPGESWRAVLLAAAAAGPLAILGALLGSPEAGLGSGLLMIVLFGPAVEEVMKAAAASYLVEKRPWLLRSRPQILFCTAMGGLVFALIENLIYLNVYIRNPWPRLILWRWTVCTALHVVCSLIVGAGLARVWTSSVAELRRPRLEGAFPFLLGAFLLHAAYNASAVVFAPAWGLR
jgi:hypothetical protein